MVERLSLHLGPSRLLAALLGSTHVLAAGALWLAPLPLAWVLAGSLALLAHLAWLVRLHAWRSDAGALIDLELLDDCSVSVRSRTGPWEPYRIAGSSFVSRPLVVLNLRSAVERRTRGVLIAADSLDADSFRRLRVWLRWRWRDGADARVSGATPGPGATNPLR
jgi:toxin CptA